MEKKNRPQMGKWSLYRFFSQDVKVKPYLPQTAILTTATLKDFLDRFKVVYVKPSGGFGGRSIVKAWKTQSGYAFVAERGTPKHVKTVEALYQAVRLSRPGMLYVVQQAIHLAKVKGHPFDIRVMMIRDEQDHWQYATMLAKVAGTNSVVTNIARGRGYVLSVDEAIQQSLRYSKERIDKLKEEMKQLGYQTCRRMDQYDYYWNLGLDLAVDEEGRVWLIEENTGPSHSLFKKLKDPSPYQRLRKMTFAYFNRNRRKKV